MFISANQVSNDNASFVGGSPIFTYDSRIMVTMLNPSRGAEAGGSSVIVLGNNFLNTTATSCKFGIVTVQGKFISNEAVLCTSPPNPTGPVRAEITSNGVDFSLSGVPFSYASYVDLASIWPGLGPASHGGTVVSIRGEGFKNTAELSCMFGNIPGVGTTWLDSTTLLCKTPPYRPGLVSVRVTNNGVDFSSSVLEYLYVDDATVEDIKPNQVLERGQVPIFVKGSNFINTTALACRFGTVAVSGLFYSPELLVCVVPSHSSQLRLQRRVGLFSLEVSINGLDYTDSGKFIQYKTVSPPGFYERDWMPVVAPNGSYSAGKGNLNFTLCNPGSFQSSSGAMRCLPCPVGFVCPGKYPARVVGNA